MRINGIVKFIRYYPNGRIKSVGSCMDIDLVRQSRLGLFVKEVNDAPDPETHYVDTSGGVPAAHALATRPTMAVALDKPSILADGIDRATLSGFPAGATVHVRGATQTVDDGVLEVTSDIDGVFEISTLR